MLKVDDYVPVVGEGVIEELRLLAERLRGVVIQNVNSTAVGGGVAEILHRLLPLLRELGVDAHWDLIKGGEKFFAVTKKFHNCLHGASIEVTKEEFDHFLEVSEANLKEMNFYGDVLFIHDPQPIVLIKKKEELGKKWVWRCHIDFSCPNPQIWEFLKTYVEQYDRVVFSAPAFSRELHTRQVLISPSIDPLSDKNKELPREQIDKILDGFGIDRTRPIITQISRFDYLKDPAGVIKVYKLVKQRIDCQLVLAGSPATDDPEGEKVFSEIKQMAEGDKDILLLMLPAGSNIEINALQRGSDVILQKSLKEGFGLTVSEGLWKAKPVIASAVGGIPLQITHKYSGILTRTIEGTAYYVRQLLNNPEYGQKLGANGREHVRNNFLITRHLRDYMLLFLSLFNEGDMIYL
ncbi:MAG: glycosyltransferase [Candidatus Brocadiaceae bacterium]|nr:glycosyltransferase [Candidatus Brocadiaceae bacterium]